MSNTLVVPKDEMTALYGSWLCHSRYSETMEDYFARKGVEIKIEGTTTLPGSTLFVLNYVGYRTRMKHIMPDYSECTTEQLEQFISRFTVRKLYYEKKLRDSDLSTEQFVRAYESRNRIADVVALIANLVLNRDDANTWKDVVR